MKKWFENHFRRHKAIYVGIFMIIKAGLPQTANCPTVKNLEEKTLEEVKISKDSKINFNYNNYNTINVKKDVCIYLP